MPIDCLPKQAFVQRLIRHHDRKIRRFIRQRSGPELLKRTSLDDLFQETAARAIDSADTFEFVDDARFLSWIYTIARRAMSRTLSTHRLDPETIRIKQARSSGRGIEEPHLPGPDRSPSSIVAGNENHVAMTAALAALPAHYREVLVLYKFQGRPLDEVAAKIGRTKGATCQLIARAISLLRQQMISP